MRLRGRGISDTAILRQMEQVPRELFVASNLSHRAYEDSSLPIGCGQSVPEPFLIAAMTQAAEIARTHKVLEVGTGSGYHTAILAGLSRRVYSVERYKKLAETAEGVLREQGLSNAVIRHGDGRYGWRGQAPFDRIIVTAGLAKPPGTLFGQLKPGGKCVAVIGGQLTVYSKAREKVSAMPLFAATLSALEPGKSKAL